MRLHQLLQAAADRLRAAGVDTPEGDARVLLAAVMGCDRAQLISDSQQEISRHHAQRFEHIVARRAGREPVARILGQREFWGMDFCLNAETLEPRPDSETLMESVVGNFPDKGARYRILDLGTGTGCLLLALLNEYGQATGVGADLSATALQQAANNAQRHQLSARCTFVQSNWFKKISGLFDIIISNPPYIGECEKNTLSPEVAQYDPALALFAGADGLDAYRTIVPRLKNFLAPRGMAFLEMGYRQWPAIETMAKNCGLSAAVRRDLSGHQRVAIITYSS